VAKHWIQNAINPAHKGMEQKAAKRAGESTHEYMEGHASDSGASGDRARLGLRLEGMHSRKKLNYSKKAVSRG
jgi:hypothetical protein